MESTQLEDGFYIQNVTENHIAALRVAGDEAARRRAAMPPEKPEPKEAAILKSLTDAAMPSVKRASKQLQRAHGENELQRRKDEAARQREALSQPFDY